MKQAQHIVWTGICAMLLGLGALAADGPWVTDWEAAKTQAAKENKLLLIDFSGSDWCGWCIKLDKEVFSQEAFLTDAKDKYVMVLLDFPRDKSGQSEALQKQNDKLQEQFEVEGFPSVFLAKADGTPIAQTGYRDGGAEAYIKHLDELVAQHRELAKLEALLPGTKGLERAKLLDQIVDRTTMDTPQKAAYMAEIIELDANNEAGLKEKHMMSAVASTLMAAMRRGDFDQAGEACDKALAWKGLSDKNRQELLLMKSQVSYAKGDKKDAKALLVKAKAVAPDSELGTKIDEILKGKWFEDVE
jgi:thioredoxin-related protein